MTVATRYGSEYTVGESEKPKTTPTPCAHARGQVRCVPLAYGWHVAEHLPGCWFITSPAGRRVAAFWSSGAAGEADVMALADAIVAARVRAVQDADRIALLDEAWA